MIHRKGFALTTLVELRKLTARQVMMVPCRTSVGSRDFRADDGLRVRRALSGCRR